MNQPGWERLDEMTHFFKRLPRKNLKKWKWFAFNMRTFWSDKCEFVSTWAFFTKPYLLQFAIL